MNRYLLVPLLLLVSCAVEESDLLDDLGEVPEDTQVSTTPIEAPPRQGMETQGRYILGSALDPLSGGLGLHYSVRTTGKTLGGARRVVEFFGQGGLRIAGKAKLADDIIFPGATGGELRIDLARAAPGITLYYLAYRATAGAGAWTDPCDGGEAVPLLGTVTTKGLHQDTPARISFACADGVAYKCFDWGYRPGGIRATEAWDIHQACTRMARADYCASGTPHTHEGTLISIFDEVGINPEPPSVFEGVNTWPPPVNRFYFEAGWRGESEPAVCLSKMRWQGLPLGGYCSSILPDPRVDVNAKFCDDYFDACASNDNTLACFSAATNTKLFNASRYADLSLHQWSAGSDLVSTIDGYYSDPAAGPSLVPYNSIGSYHWVAADALLLRSLPDSISPADVVDVALYSDGAQDLVYLPISAADLLPGYFNLNWKGMAFINAGSGTAPLTLFQNTVTGDAMTSTLPPPPGYVSLGTVGHVGTFDQPE